MILKEARKRIDFRQSDVLLKSVRFLSETFTLNKDQKTGF